MPHGKVVQVFIFKTGEFLGSDVFEKESITVGREMADLVLDSAHVSRHHATIEHDGETIRVADAGSKNGMYLNDSPVKSAVMGRLDRLSIGEYTLTMKLLGPEDRLPPPAGRATLKSDAPVMGATMEGQLSDLHPFDAPPDAVTGDLSLLETDERGSAPPQSKSESESESDEERERIPVTNLGPKTVEDLGALDSTNDENVGVERTEISVGAPPPAADKGSPRRDKRARAPSPTPDLVVPRQLVPEETYDDLDDSAVGWRPEFQDGMDMAWDHAPFVHGTEDDDHDDDDEMHFRPPYSLAERLVAAPPGSGTLDSTYVEMLSVVHDKVVDVTLISAVNGSWTHETADHEAGGVQSLRCGKDGECLVVATGRLRGSLRRGDETIDLHDFMRVHDKTHQGVFRRGEAVNLSNGHTHVHLRHVHRPPLPPDQRSLREKLGVDGAMFYVLIASLVAHILMLIAVAVLTPPTQPPHKDQEFVVAVKAEPQLQEPKEPPKPPEPPEPPKPQRPEKKVKAHVRPTKHTKVAPVREAAPVQAPPGILGLLSKKGATQAPGPAAAVAAVSNLNAVKVPGAAGGFRVSGLVGKLPASAGVSVGGGGGLVTKGANTLLRGGGGGAGKMADIGQRRVGGLVQKVVRGMHMTGGSLERSEIERVVNQHTDEIQRCYERELLHDSSLAGKVQVEWTIALDGSVPNVRQMFSSVQSPAVVRCIMDAIKTWRFPRPQGGAVVVDFPFILKGMDF